MLLTKLVENLLLFSVYAALCTHSMYATVYIRYRQYDSRKSSLFHLPVFEGIDEEKLKHLMKPCYAPQLIHPSLRTIVNAIVLV